MSEQDRKEVSAVTENFEQLPTPLQKRLNDIAYGMRLAKDAAIGSEDNAAPQK